MSAALKQPEPEEFTWGPAEPHFGCSKRLGMVENPEGHIERDKARIMARLGNMAGIRMAGNNVIVALWETQLKKVGSILLTDDTAGEDMWQAKAGVVVAMGPHAFVSDENRAFLPEEVPQVGDWVMFRKGDGPTLQVWGHECIMLGDTSIRAILDRPDAVY